LGNLNMVLQSPGYYSEFVTHDAAQGLAELWLLRTGSPVATPAEVPLAAPAPPTQETNDITLPAW
jgi:hypothetical protein